MAYRKSTSAETTARFLDIGERKQRKREAAAARMPGVARLATIPAPIRHVEQQLPGAYQAWTREVGQPLAMFRFGVCGSPLHAVACHIAGGESLRYDGKAWEITRDI